MTEQRAFAAQEPGHGSLHFLFMQAKLLEQSSFTTHSGRQFGDVPIKSGKHEHEGNSPFTWHTAFGPQGDGMHGLDVGASAGGGAVKWI